VKHAVDYELTPIIYGTLIASTLGLSLLTWRYVEQPFRSRSGISFKRVIFWWVLADVLLLGYGLVGKWTEGLPHRPNLMERHPETVGHADFYQALSTFPVCLPDRVAKSTVVYEQITRCRQSKPNSLPTVVLVGDSHAEHLFFGFSEQLKTENVAVYLNRTYPFSREADFAEINDYVLSSSSIHTVVIGVQWKRWFDDRPSDVSLHEALLQTVRPWLKNGKRVYLMGDIPMFPFSAERCKYKLKYAIDDICTVAAAKVITQQKEFMHELERVIEDLPQVELLMVRELFCKDALCSMTPANALMYRDESHLNMEGSRYVIEELTKKHPSLKSK